MSRPPLKFGRVGQADLLTLLHAGGNVDRLATYAGYERRPKTIPQIAVPPLKGPDQQAFNPETVPVGPSDPTPLEFLYPDSFRTIKVPSQDPQPVVDHVPTWHDAPKSAPKLIPLATSQTIESLIASLSKEKQRGRRIDVECTVSTLARGRPLQRLPRQDVRRVPTLQIIADRSRHLAPFWEDQVKVITSFGKRPFTLWVFDELDMRLVHLESREAREPNPNDGPLVVLGDLGAFGTAEYRRFWLDFGRRMARIGAQLTTLAPCLSDDMPANLVKLWSPRPWEPPLASTQYKTRAEHVEELLTLASPVARLEPGLLRALRRRCTTADPTAELLVWRHEALASSNLTGATFKPDAIDKYRNRFHELARENPDRAIKAWAEIRAWRGRIGYEFMFEEILDLPKDVRECIVQDHDIRAAERFWTEIGAAAQAGTLQTDALRWLHETSFRRPPGVWSGALWDHPAANRALTMAGSSIAQPQTRQLTLSQQGAELSLGEASQGAPLAFLNDASGIVEILPAPDLLPPLTTFRDRLASAATGPEMVSLPTGSFLMGSPEDEEDRYSDESPQHRVEITEPYALAKYPVTFAEYDTFCAATGRQKPDDQGWGRGQRPVINVSWEDAREYCDWLSVETGEAYRLPSEAEWEYACRAQRQTPYWWGNDWGSQRANAAGANSKTTEVGHYDPNPWGLYDTHGNVLEWCEDNWQEDYAPPRTQAAFLSSSGRTDRVIRGGSWSSGAVYCRSAARNRLAPGARLDDLGFRPARGQASGAQASKHESAERSGLRSGEGRMAEPRPERRAGPPPRRGGASAFSDTKIKRLRVTPGGTASIAMSELPPAPFVVRTDRAELVIQRITRTALGDWASGMGRDRFGLWADFEVNDLLQRLRWCPPGRFLMGSPEDEPGRDDSEGPQTEITFGLGFWLFDTPVTQALYEAVMGENPSQFVSPTRPVESVDFKQAGTFIKALNGLKPGLDLRLPSEAEWEYACRAGTTDATYAGPIEILGANNAPILDHIAWYGGNSGTEFELENGYDSSEWPEKRFEHNKAGTMPVKLKRQNPWGLYDMLGNVWEWCEDAWHESLKDISPEGLSWQGSQQGGGSVRVIRGGSFDSGARYCRSACRFRFAPDDRIGILGFRPARGQATGAQATGGQAGRQESAERSGLRAAATVEAEPTGARSEGPPSQRGGASGISPVMKKR